MRGLVERLRERGRWGITDRVPLFPQTEEWQPDPDCREAADEIERLRAVAHAAWHLLDEAGEDPDDDRSLHVSSLDAERLSTALDAAGWGADEHGDEVVR